MTRSLDPLEFARRIADIARQTRDSSTADRLIALANEMLDNAGIGARSLFDVPKPIIVPKPADSGCNQP